MLEEEGTLGHSLGALDGQGDIDDCPLVWNRT